MVLFFSFLFFFFSFFETRNLVDISFFSSSFCILEYSFVRYFSVIEEEKKIVNRL